MNAIEKLIRPSILKVKAYSSARDEFQGVGEIWLDANENPNGDFNRYPDPYQRVLKRQLCALKNIEESQLFIGNGSDEAIDLLFRIFCEPGRDKALIFPPTYGMYEVSAAINDTELVKLPLTADFQLNKKAILSSNALEESKLIFICSPNNPTGNSINDINWILERTKGIVVIDEAYIDFSQNPSALLLLKKYPNLVVLQTLSKAFGLANLRIGLAMASSEIIAVFNKIKPPYNVSGINQQMASERLENFTTIQKEIDEIIQIREELTFWLTNQSICTKVYPSEANFLLIEVENADDLYTYLSENSIVIRNRNSQIKNTLRISIGTSEEIKKLKENIKTFQNEKSTIY